MHDSALHVIRSHLDDAHLAWFAIRLHEWLLVDQVAVASSLTEFSESRAKSLLRSANVIDGPTLKQFLNLVNGRGATELMATRVAVYDLLKESGLAENEEIIAMAVACAAADVTETSKDLAWLTLTIAAYSWKDGFPLSQLDPSSPPEEFSPAGQVVRGAAHFMRRQVLRSATEREKLGRRLAYSPGSPASGHLTLEEMPPQTAIPPLPPHFRPPIPVNYPEVAQETLQVEVEGQSEDENVVSLEEPISISDDDLSREGSVQRMPPIRITTEQAQAPASRRSRVVTPAAKPAPLASFTRAVQRRFSRGQEPLTSTKLRVRVQMFPDGPGLYGLQVRVTCKGVKSYVAGTTSREGEFLCELPVRLQSGLTYDVAVTWPRDLGGEVELKSITLNADRTEFVMPFYHRIQEDNS